ncbi:MAG: hypothetical protein GF353_11550, partial [Candidatus Lokiarchaeota archaeon]|nr:hypothetical protein [Candidatus Lokiarchaeota archaeon]
MKISDSNSCSKSFRINNFITLRLISNKTVIFIKGKPFRNCKYLLLNISMDKVERFDDINSIDEAAEKLSNTMEHNNNRKYKKKIGLDPLTEFWGHCSNLQAWAENGYNTRILHRNLAFPLLKKLTEAGDPRAQKIFKEEIVERLFTGNKTVRTYLLNQSFISYLNRDDLRFLIDEIAYNGNIKEKETLIIEIGWYLLEIKRHIDALKFFEDAIKKIPYSASIIYNLGEIYSVLREHHKAIQQFFKLIQLDCKNAEAWNSIGIELSHLRNYRGAINAYKIALNLKPFYFNALDNLTEAYSNSGKPNKARKIHQRIVELDPIHIVEKRDLAIYYYKYQRDFKKAEGFCKEILKHRIYSKLAWQILVNNYLEE